MVFKIIKFYLLLLCIVIITPLSGRATPAAEEYQIKAVFLYNFANFITWPETAFKNTSIPFTVCILGEDPFGQYLDITLKDQKSRGHSFETRRIRNIAEAKPCHILFISQSEKNRFREIFSFTRNYTILTVGDMENFVEQGGMIEFSERNKKVKLNINPCAIEQVNLKAAADLLRLAQIMRNCR
jgi:hypothetical protein